MIFKLWHRMIFKVNFPRCNKFLILLLGIMEFIAFSTSEIIYIFTSMLKFKHFFPTSVDFSHAYDIQREHGFKLAV